MEQHSDHARGKTSVPQIYVPRLEEETIQLRVDNLLGGVLKLQSVGEWLCRREWSCERVFGCLKSEMLKSEMRLHLPEVVLDQDLQSINGEKILGAFDARNNCIFIDKSLSKDGPLYAKREWVLWHEHMHWLLHRDLILCHRDRSPCRVQDTEETIDRKSVVRLEWQANRAASFAALPPKLLDTAFKGMYKGRTPIWSGPGMYDIEGVSIFIESIGAYAARFGRGLKPIFGGISGEAIGYRLLDLKLIQVVDRAPKNLHFSHTLSRYHRPMQ